MVISICGKALKEEFRGASGCPGCLAIGSSVSAEEVSGGGGRERPGGWALSGDALRAPGAWHVQRAVQRPAWSKLQWTEAGLDLGFDPEDEGQSRKGLKHRSDRITYVFL